MGAGAEGARAGGAFSAAASALVDDPERVLRKRGNEDRPAELRLGWHEAAWRPAAASLYFSAHACRMGPLRAPRRPSRPAAAGNGLLRRRAVTPPLLFARAIAGLDLRLD